MIDSHCHLQLCKEPVEDILLRAQQRGLTSLVQVATDVETAHFGLDLAKKKNLPIDVHPTAGLYPSRAEGDWASQMADLETCLKDPLVVALGEVGIDLYHDKTYLDRQEEMLKAQIQLAIQWDKPMIFHIRHSYDEVVAILDEFGESCPPGVWHCFEGTLDQAKAFVKRGWMISFSGLVTFKKNDDIRDVARWVPDEHLLIETDSPYLSPEPLRREKNEPHKVSMVADCLAKLRGISASSCADLTANNTRRLFRF